MKNLSLLFIVFLFLVPNFTLSQQSSVWDQIPEEIKDTKQFQRFEWFYKQRAYPYDTIPVYYYQTERERIISEIEEGNLNSPNQLVWTSIGPAGIENISSLSHWGISSGRVRALAIHPNDPMTVYIGAACGGLWKTTNGGNSWAAIGEDSESLSYGAIAIDPNNPDIIYSGTGEVDYYTWNYHIDGKGIYKSTDGGNSWNQIVNGFGIPTHFGDLVVSHHNSNIVFAALASGSFYVGNNLPNEGIWKSTDAGLTWTKTLDVQDAYDIVIHPTESNIVYAGIGGMLTTSGFYISTDAGETWTQSNNGLQATNTIARMQIDLAQSSPNILYSVIFQSTGLFSGTSKAYKSIDGGVNWTQISVGTQLGGNYGDGWFDQGFYDLFIVVDPLDPDHVLLGNVELHETFNGSDFSPKRPYGSNAWGSPAHVDYHRLAYSQSNPNHIYLGCDGGVYKSTDGGTTFSSANNGLSTLQFYRLASHPTDVNILLGGTQDNGNFRTTDGGMTPWSVVGTGDGMECFWDYTEHNIVYMSTQNGRLLKSVNGGLNPYVIRNVSGSWITPFFMHPTDHLTLYSATQYVWRSTNGGSNWSPISTNISPTEYINTMAQNRVNPDNMIIAGSGDFNTTPIVKISTDGGFTWSADLSGNIPGEPRWISRVVTHSTNPNTMYIVRTGFSPGNKIYKTTDFGNAWTNISGDLPDLPCNDLFVDPYNIHPNNQNHLYVANDIGVFKSVDGGISWQYVSDGVPWIPAMDFDYVVIGNAGHLRIATHGRSAFTTDLTIPVELVSFTGKSELGKVYLGW